MWEIALHFPDNKIMFWFVCGDLDIILIDKMKIESSSVLHGVNNIVSQHNEMLVLIAISSNDGSGESAQMHRLAKAFAAHIHSIRV